MEAIDRFGPPLFDYNGTATVTYLRDGQRLAYFGRFQARQAETASVVIAFKREHINVPSGGATFPLDPAGRPGHDVEFEGFSDDGSRLTNAGTLLSQPPLGPMLSPDEQIYVWDYLWARDESEMQESYHSARFLLSTWAWPGRPNSPSKPVAFEANGFRVSVTPWDNRHRVNQSFGVKRVYPTAWVHLIDANGSGVTLQDFAYFMDDLIYAFRLAAGAGVEWYFGEVISDQNAQAVERLHKGAIHGPTESSWANSTPDLDLGLIAEAMLARESLVLDWATLKELINYFVSACDAAVLLELRGLHASTLTEVITAKYAEKKGIGDFISVQEFKNVETILREAVNGTGLDESVKQHIISHLQGAYRRSFRQWLKYLIDGLDSGINSRTRGDVVNIRNALVHRGTYPSATKEWLNNYHLMIWLDFVSLSRLVGYRGKLPDLTQDWILDA